MTTGIGVFDSMLVKDSELQYGQDHYDRLIHDADTVIGAKSSLSFSDFENIIHELLKKNSLTDGFVRVRSTITGGEVNAPLAKSDTPTIFISAAATTLPDTTTPLKCAVITDFPRIAGCKLENCKRLDYSRSYAARRKAEELGAGEAILTNTEGNIACGATSNIFIRENGKLITPPLSDGILAGVTRKNIMKEKEVIEESISIDRLRSADKIYLTNSFFGMREIKIVA
ncbi:MAG: aminotransferase class IV [Pseudomonadota bacterium]